MLPLKHSWLTLVGCGAPSLQQAALRLGCARSDLPRSCSALWWVVWGLVLPVLRFAWHAGLRGGGCSHLWGSPLAVALLWGGLGGARQGDKRSRGGWYLRYLGAVVPSPPEREASPRSSLGLQAPLEMPHAWVAQSRTCSSAVPLGAASTSQLCL